MMKKWNIGILVVALAFAVGCCITRTTVNTSEIIDAVEIIVERHDAYVNADPDLYEADKAGYLNESTALIILISNADTVDRVTIEPAAAVVCARHDEYVAKDQISETQRRRWLRTTQILMEVIRAGD